MNRLIYVEITSRKYKYINTFTGLLFRNLLTVIILIFLCNMSNAKKTFRAGELYFVDTDDYHWRSIYDEEEGSDAGAQFRPDENIGWILKRGGAGYYLGVYGGTTYWSNPPVHNSHKLDGAPFSYNTGFGLIWRILSGTATFGTPPDNYLCYADKKKSGTKEPINTISGGMYRDEVDIVIPCSGPDLKFTRSYNSGQHRSHALGPRWAYSFDWTIEETNGYFGVFSNDYLKVETETGDTLALVGSKTETNFWVTYRGKYWTITKDSNNWYILKDGRDITWSFDTNGILKTISDPWDNEITLTYTNQAGTNLLLSAEHSSGLSINFTYNTNGLISLVSSPNTNLFVSYSYNTNGELTNVIRNTGQEISSISYEYDFSGNHSLEKIINPINDIYEYGYATNSSGDTISQCTNMILNSNYYAHSVTYYTNNNYSKVSYQERGTNQIYDYCYDNELLLITNIYGPNTHLLNHKYERDEYLNVTNEIITDDIANEYIQIVKKYDKRKNPISIASGYCQYPDNKWLYSYENIYNVITNITDPDGHITKIEYTNNLPTEIKTYYNQNNYYTTKFSYTTNGLLASVTNANNHYVEYGYDNYGRLNLVDPQLGPTITYSNNILGYVEKVVMPGASGDRITTFTPDELGRIHSITYPDNSTEYFAYDASGNLTNHIDAEGVTARYTYLPTRKLSSVSIIGNGITNTTGFTYDQQFNTLNIKDARDAVVEGYQLDLQDRPVSVTNVENQTMSITYGVEDYIKQITRFDGTVVANSYNGDGWLSEIRYPDSTNKYTYYKNGLLKTSGNELGTISNQYDGANRLIRVDSGNSWAEYSLDGIGNATNTTISINSTVSLTNTYTFDAAERVSGINSTGGAFTYAYNQYNGLVSAITNTTTGSHVEYSYDIMDRLQSIKWKDSSGNTIRSFDYTYNLSGMITNITLETGEEISYTYDTMQRLKSESSEVGDQRSDVSYSYDAVGNRLSKTVDGITVNYNHPYGTSGNRLASWTATSTNNFELLRTISVAGHSSEEIGTNDMFGVLWVSNSIAVTPEVDGTNFSVNSFVVGSGTQEIVAAIRDEAGNVGYATNTITTRIVTNAAYSYSDAGCLTNITYTGISYPETSTTLKWNSQYQLTSVSTNGALVESYQYDSLGRRACSVRSMSGISTTTNYYIYNGIQCVADIDSSGNLLRSYTWGPGVDNLLAMTVYTGSVVRTYYALTDHLGTVHALTDLSGNIVESYKYDAWGKVLGVYNNAGNPLTSDLGSPTSGIGNRYLWQGREYSWATGFYNFRARWYDPITGRWLSKDPIGISGGLNQYVFVENNPVNARDPLGLWNLWSPATWGVANGVGWSWRDSINPFHESAGWSGYGWGASEGAAAALDGIIPIWDPFEIAYTDECGNTKTLTEWSRALGQYSRDIYIATLGLRGVRFRGIERGAWKVNGTWQTKQLHFHLDWGKGLGSHHLPQQMGNFLKNLRAVITR